jgi:hypothetical protein
LQKQIYSKSKESRILSSVLNALLPDVEFRKVLPSDYRLFQVADLICTLELIRLKMEAKTLAKHDLESIKIRLATYE